MEEWNDGRRRQEREDRRKGWNVGMMEEWNGGEMEKPKKSSQRFVLGPYQYSNTPMLHYSKDLMYTMKAKCLRPSSL